MVREINLEEKVNDALSVADYIAILNAALTKHGTRITGEVCEVKPWNGHVYFSLKDKNGEALLRCVIWQSAYRMSGVELENGMEVVIGGAPNIYAKNGSLTFSARTIELVGEGALKKQYEKLKAKLTAEGLFELSRKRPLPQYPHVIGVVTSKMGGVVIYDYSNNLKKFGFVSKIVDSRVEGADAVKELYDSLQTLKKQKIDVLVVIRGGGSLESFAPFNNELLVREIAEFPVPVIVGVGHHVDVCLAGLAADHMVSTPTAAAELLNDSWEKAIYRVESSEQQLLNTFARILSKTRSDLERSSRVMRDKFNSIFERFREGEKILVTALHRFEFLLHNKKEKLKHSFDTIARRFLQEIQNKKTYLDSSLRSINQGNPERQLKLGYSIIKSKDKIVRSVSELCEGETIELMVSDGRAESEIKKIFKS